MMQALSQTNIGCPYCGEMIEVLVEAASESFEYIEDCQVCCRPIVIHIELSLDGEQSISARSENEVY